MVISQHRGQGVVTGLSFSALRLCPPAFRGRGFAPSGRSSGFDWPPKGRIRAAGPSASFWLLCVTPGHVLAPNEPPRELVACSSLSSSPCCQPAGRTGPWPSATRSGGGVVAGAGGLRGGALGSAPCGLSSSTRPAPDRSRGSCRDPSGHPQGLLSPRLALCHFHCILPAKASHKSSSDSGGEAQTPSLQGKSCKVTLQRVRYGEGWRRVLFLAVCLRLYEK